MGITVANAGIGGAAGGVIGFGWGVAMKTLFDDDGTVKYVMGGAVTGSFVGVAKTREFREPVQGYKLDPSDL